MAYPDVQLTLTESTSDVQIAALAGGQGDAGIIISSTQATLPVALSYRKLLSEPLIAAIPEHWVKKFVRGKQGAQAKLSIKALAEWPLIMFPRRLAPAYYDLVMGFYEPNGGQARIAQHAIQMQTIISLVSAEMGIALVPQSLRHLARTGVRYVNLEGKVPYLETGIAWHRDNDNPTLARFLEVATKNYGKPSGIRDAT
jgi:DNA-binding transcriptional LysR family regulator